MGLSERLLRSLPVVQCFIMQEEALGRDSTVIQVRTDSGLRAAFTKAVQRDHTTTSDALRTLMQEYVRDSLSREAARQCHLVAAAPSSS